jgi:hypothetical protein
LIVSTNQIQIINGSNYKKIVMLPEFKITKGVRYGTK